MISKLKAQGFIVQKDRVWGITEKGKIKLSRLLGSPIRAVTHDPYQKGKGSEVIIFVFDIPEREKHKRRWLRARLVELGFSMLQKSVWIGKVKIPKEFLEDIRELRLVSCVEILSVSRSGTLKIQEV